MLTRFEIGNKQVGMLNSGGLAAWAVTRFLHTRGTRVRAVWADVGQTDEPFVSEFFEDMDRLGVAVDRIDLRPELGDLAMRMIKYTARYEGGYWNSTGALRYALLRSLAPRLSGQQCQVLGHGCVAGGNDEKRFNRYSREFGDGIGVFSPFRDPEVVAAFPGREAMVRYLINGGVDAKVASKSVRSTDGCSIGASYEGADIESLESDFVLVEPTMSRLPWACEHDPKIVEVEFRAGVPVALDGVAMSADGLLDRANQIAGQHGVSLRTVVESRISDTKCKGVYESPGMDLLSFAFTNLLRVVLGKEALSLYVTLSEQVGKSIYQGRFTEPAVTGATRALDAITAPVTGTVRARVYRGNLHCVGITVGGDNKAPEVQQRRFISGGHTWHDSLVGASLGTGEAP